MTAAPLLASVPDLPAGMVVADRSALARLSPDWEVVPAGEANGRVVAFDPRRLAVVVIHGRPTGELADALGKTGHRRAARLGEVEVWARATSPAGSDLPCAATGGKLTLSVEEAAEILGISRALAYTLVTQRRIPSLKLGRRVVVPRRALEDLLHTASQDPVG